MKKNKFISNQLVLSILTFLIFSTMNINPINAEGKPIVESDTLAIQGNWDITVNVNGKMFPSWLEIKHSGHQMLVGRFVGIVGSARPVSRINIKNGKMSFSIPPQWETEPNDLYVEGTLQGDSLIGTMIFSNGQKHDWVGKRAPSLRRKVRPLWGKPIHLFDGTNMNEWHATGKNQWKVESGLLRSPKSGSNIVTNQVFNDFKLHIEFRYPKESNSGVYLRGRYEIQIIDSVDKEPSDVLLGAVYGFLTPSDMVAKLPGEWQSFDITLIGRMITVVANGKMIICNQAIPGITGGAINSDEGAPGPIQLQGDHGPIDFRNIVITPAK